MYFLGITLDTDESYSLTVSSSSDGRILATVKGENFFGARHGLETLGQLIIYDDIRNEIQVRIVTVFETNMAVILFFRLWGKLPLLKKTNPSTLIEEY